jgi:hypothetical protein
VPFTANSLEDSSVVGCYAVSTSSLLVGVPKRHCGFTFSVKYTKNITIVHGVTTEVALILSKPAVISWLGLMMQVILVCHFCFAQTVRS